jgi:hypothetical protein
MPAACSPQDTIERLVSQRRFVETEVMLQPRHLMSDAEREVRRRILLAAMAMKREKELATTSNLWC